MNELVCVSSENQTVMLLRRLYSGPPQGPTRMPRRLESCPAQVFANLKHSWQKLENILAANIRPGDLIGVLTYRDDALPGSRRDVQSDFSYAMRKLRRSFEALGHSPPRIIWSMERSHADGVNKGARWHIHFALRSEGAEDREAVQRCWTKGIVLMTSFTVDPVHWVRGLGVTVRITSESSRGYEPLARYMCKEAQERLGQRTWSYSRACVKPEIERIKVDADYKIVVPPRATVLAHRLDGERWEMIKFINF